MPEDDSSTGAVSAGGDTSTVRAVGAQLERGHRIGHYKILEQIGEGGFAIVYLAEQEKPVRRTCDPLDISTCLAVVTCALVVAPASGQEQDAPLTANRPLSWVVAVQLPLRRKNYEERAPPLWQSCRKPGRLQFK